MRTQKLGKTSTKTDHILDPLTPPSSTLLRAPSPHLGSTSLAFDGPSLVSPPPPAPYPLQPPSPLASNSPSPSLQTQRVRACTKQIQVQNSKQAVVLQENWFNYGAASDKWIPPERRIHPRSEYREMEGKRDVPFHWNPTPNPARVSSNTSAPPPRPLEAHVAPQTSWLGFKQW